jgi:hypothetical protein
MISVWGNYILPQKHTNNPLDEGSVGAFHENFSRVANIDNQRNSNILQVCCYAIAFS